MAQKVSAQALDSAKRIRTQLALEMPWNEINYSKMEEPYFNCGPKKEVLGQPVSQSAALGIRTTEKEDRKHFTKNFLFSCSPPHPFFTNTIWQTSWNAQ